MDAITLDVDVLLRISAVLGIHQALSVLFPGEPDGIKWLTAPHGAIVFGGRPPLDLLTCGTQGGLMMVRRYLDGAGGGLYITPNIIGEAFEPYSDKELLFL